MIQSNNSGEDSQIDIYLGDPKLIQRLTLYTGLTTQEKDSFITEQITNLQNAYNFSNNDFNLFDFQTDQLIINYEQLSAHPKIMIKFLKQNPFLQSQKISLSNSKSSNSNKKSLYSNLFPEPRKAKYTIQWISGGSEHSSKRNSIVDIMHYQDQSWITSQHKFFHTMTVDTIPLDGSNPRVLSAVQSLGSFSFVHPNPPQDIACPPPVYLNRPEIIGKLKATIPDLKVQGFERTERGDLKVIDKSILDRLSGIIPTFIKELTISLAEGRGFVGVSLPVRIFEPRSLLERITEWWSQFPQYVNIDCKNPIDRMVNLIVATIGGLSASATFLKPFNPLFGETFHGKFPDGSEVYCEHVSHHPPITRFLIQAKRFKMNGKQEFVTKTSGFFNDFHMIQEGNTVIDQGNGERIVFKWPRIKMQGMILGDKRVKWAGTVTQFDEKNGIKGVVKLGKKIKVPNKFFDQKHCEMIEGKIQVVKQNQVQKKIKSRKEQEREDQKMLDKQQDIITITGSWLDSIQINGQESWNFQKDRPILCLPAENPLPSDGRFREDLCWLVRGDQKISQKWKTRIEETQRLEKKYRLEGEKARKKK